MYADDDEPLEAEASSPSAHEGAPSDDGEAHGHHGFHPHAPQWAINTVLILLSVGHALAALKHHWVDRSDVLSRMIDPRRSRRP